MWGKFSLSLYDSLKGVIHHWLYLLNLNGIKSLLTITTNTQNVANKNAELNIPICHRNRFVIIARYAYIQNAQHIQLARDGIKA